VAVVSEGGDFGEWFPGDEIVDLGELVGDLLGRVASGNPLGVVARCRAAGPLGFLSPANMPCYTTRVSQPVVIDGRRYLLVDPTDRHLHSNPSGHYDNSERITHPRKVHAQTRLDAGPDADLLDPAVRQAWEWRDMVLEPIETPAPTLRLTG